MASILIYIIFIIAFFGGSLVGYNLVPAHVTLATEALVYLLFLYSWIVSSHKHKSYCLHLSSLFAFFVIIAFCSVLVNKSLNISALQGLRLILRFYIFYLALINLGLGEGQLKRINKLLFFLFIIQIPVAAIKLPFYGIGEWTIGTYAVSGGGLTTVIPIVALGYLAGYYFFYDCKRLYWLLAFGFIFFGIAGGKAALLFLLPVTFLGLYYLIYIKEKHVSLPRAIYVTVLLVLLSSAVAGVIIKYNPRLNPEREVGGSLDLSYALKYSEKYTTGKRALDPRFGTGRFSTTMLAFAQLFREDVGHIFFGYGPGALSRYSIYNLPNKTDSLVYGVAGSYGVTGMVFVLTEYGLFGLIVLSLIFSVLTYMSWKWYSSEIEPYWKAFALGSLVFAFLSLFIFLAYNTIPVKDDVIPPVFYYAMAIMYLRLKEIKREKVVGQVA